MTRPGGPAPVEVAVVPAAGFGTRFLPATKAVAKEMFPIVQRPAIQVIAEEAAASGVNELVVITGRNKVDIVDHFDRHPELEAVLARDGKDAALSSIMAPVELLSVTTTRQREALGLGHAVLRARALVGDRPFAVMLPDDLVRGPDPCLAGLLDAHRRTGKAAVALMEVPDAMVPTKGIVAAARRDDGAWDISDMVEKPTLQDAPSNLAIIGRYVLPPKIFDLLERTTPGALGEIQLTDALRALARTDGIVGVPLPGVFHDTGNPVGFIVANVAYALDDPALEAPLRRALEKLLWREAASAAEEVEAEPGEAP